MVTPLTCPICYHSLVEDPEAGQNKVDEKITYVMACCKAMVHEECLIRQMQKDKNKGDTSECPNDRCRTEIQDPTLLQKSMTTMDHVKKWAPLGAIASLVAIGIFGLSGK
ncbi:MAG: hypothetical protein KDK48_02935 [Chlamydiia bacterium]|nr:hypothetical protein [Chlamydiia bacterium]